jgi:LmbE family N-acetylglucosaminyl deacetylase
MYPPVRKQTEMLMIILITPLLIPLLWLVGFLCITDFAIPSGDVRAFRRVLVIFPHADDEAVTCGGLLHRLSHTGCAVTLVILTKGERGTPNAILDDALKAVRTREAHAATAALGIARLVQEDFGDGTLHEKKPELAACIEKIIGQEQPDLLITYDLAGFYGHADHIACSQVVTELKERCFPAVRLWYATFPKQVLARVKLPEHMRLDARMQAKQTLPTRKVFIGSSVFPKIKAWYAYKSQRGALTKGVGRLLPIWFFLSMMLFEYFAEVG